MFTYLTLVVEGRGRGQDGDAVTRFMQGAKKGK